MGTARAPVVGSGTWPPCTARVASCCGFCSVGSAKIRSLFVSSLISGCGYWGCRAAAEDNGMERKQPESALGPGPPVFKIVCVYRIRRSRARRTGRHMRIHMYIAITAIPKWLKLGIDGSIGGRGGRCQMKDRAECLFSIPCSLSPLEHLRWNREQPSFQPEA